MIDDNCVCRYRPALHLLLGEDEGVLDYPDGIPAFLHLLPHLLLLHEEGRTAADRDRGAQHHPGTRGKHALRRVPVHKAEVSR